MATLSERISESVQTSGAAVSAIAEKCGVSVQAVYQWMNGDTKQIMGDYLVELAELTGFEARWIAKGIGPKQRRYAKTAQQEHVLVVMQDLQPLYTDMVLKIVDTIAESKPDEDNGGNKAAA